VRFSSQIHVLDDVEVVAEREILVHDLDPEPSRVLRAVDAHDLTVEEDLAAVDRVDARDGLDQRRLAGAVVADERHHLAVADLEVDVRQRLDGSERLGDVAELEGGSAVPTHGAKHTTRGATRDASRFVGCGASFTCRTSRRPRCRPGSS
jgi:hypothetical protein